MKPLSNLAVRDIETVIHPYTNLATHRDTGPLVLERAKGVRIWDSDGRDYIEGLAGLWCTSLGYGNEELIEAATTQLERLPYTHLFGSKSHDPAIELSERIKEIAPCEASKVFLTCSGSEANEVADMAHDGLARTIYPVHTPADGDTLFALSTGRGPAARVGRVGALAAEAVARAVLDAVRSAESLPGYPAVGDLPAPPEPRVR